MLSTALIALLGCAVHLGTAPAATRWTLAEVVAPVAEPDVDVHLRGALLDALAARRALDPGGAPLTATVLDASWVPTRRSGDALLYEARLAVLFEGGGRSGVRRRVRVALDPGDAAAARAARDEAFRELARQVAEDGVSWLLQP